MPVGLIDNRLTALTGSCELVYLFLQLLLPAGFGKMKGLTGFDSIDLCKCKHVLRCVISSLI
jgi:hypothetical protein